MKIWGMLAEGQLHYHILPAGENMNKWYYAWLIEKKFPAWRGSCEYLVQDFEKCLRCDEPMEELRKIKMTLVEEHPKYSQDLNAVENAWKILRDRLIDTMPTHLEPRVEFVARLRAAVRWININREDELLYLGTNQKERARDVKDLDGARTKW